MAGLYHRAGQALLGNVDQNLTFTIGTRRILGATGYAKWEYRYLLAAGCTLGTPEEGNQHNRAVRTEA